MEFESFDVEPLLSCVAAGSRAQAHALLLDLFPRLRPKNSVGYGSPQGKRLCEDAYFDRYFAMSIPAHDVSDREVADAVHAAISGDDTTLVLLLRQQETKRLD